LGSPKVLVGNKFISITALVTSTEDLTATCAANLTNCKWRLKRTLLNVVYYMVKQKKEKNANSPGFDLQDT